MTYAVPVVDLEDVQLRIGRQPPALERQPQDGDHLAAACDRQAEQRASAG